MDAWAPHVNYIKNNQMKILLVIIFCRSEQKEPGGLEPSTFRLTAKRTNQLRQGDLHEPTIFSF